MIFPETVLEIAKRVANNYTYSVEDAVLVAESEIRVSPEFQDFEKVVIRNTVRDLIYQARHRSNVKTRDYSQSHKYNETQKGDIKGINAIYHNVYCYFIGGKTLGKLLGSEIDGIVKSEKSNARTRLNNVKLLEWIKSQGIADTETVEKAIPLRKLTSIFKRIFKKETAKS